MGSRPCRPVEQQIQIIRHTISKTDEACTAPAAIHAFLFRNYLNQSSYVFKSYPLPHKKLNQMNLWIRSENYFLRPVVNLSDFCFPCHITVFNQPLLISFSKTCCYVLIGPSSGTAEFYLQNQMSVTFIFQILL